MARPSSTSTPGSTKRKREGGGDTPKSKKSKQKGKRPFDEGRSFSSQGDLKKMDSPAVQRAKREIKIRRLTAEQINALERAFDDADGKLSHPQKVEIAKRIGLEARQVAIWFQNRRAKWRTEQVENQYDVLKQENQRLADENKRLRKEMEAMRIALAATRAGIAHPTPSRVEAIPAASLPASFATKDGESPGSVYDKLQNLIKSMKNKRSAFFSPEQKGKQLSNGGTSASSSYESSESDDSSSSEDQQPIQRAKRSSLPQKKTPATTSKVATPRAKGGGKASPAGKKAAPPAAAKSTDRPPASGSGGKPPTKGRLQRELSIGQRRGSKLEALKLPVKMNPAGPLFADKDRPRGPVDAPTPKMGGPSKPGVPTPGSTPSMWPGSNLDPSPTTGPLANGSPSQGGAPGSAEALLEQVPPSALGRGFSHLLNSGPQGSPTESDPSPTTYLLTDFMEGSPTTGALAADGGELGKASAQKPSPLGAEAPSKEAKLQLAPSTREWGEAMRKAEQQRNELSSHALQGAGQKEDELPLGLAREAPRDFRRSVSPGSLPPVQKFPNTAAQDFLAKYRAVYGEINRSAEGGAPLEQASRAADSLLAFVNGKATGEEERGPQLGGRDDELPQRLELNGRSMDALALFNLGGGPRPSSGGDKELELSLDLGSLGHLRSLLAEQVGSQQLAAAGGGTSLLARGGGASFLSEPQATSSAFDVFHRTGNLLDPYQDPPFPRGLGDERALSPSLREAISQHQNQSAQASGTVFLSLEGRKEGGGLGGGA